MRKHFNERLEELIYNMNDFPVFSHWDFNKQEFKEIPLNKLSSRFVKVIVDFIPEVIGRSMTEEQLELHVARAVLNAANYAYFGNATYEAGNANSHGGGDDSIQEQFTAWALSLDNEEYFQTVKKYREKKIYLNSVWTSVKGQTDWIQDYPHDIKNLIRWVRGSDLLVTFNKFKTKKHPAFKDQTMIDYTILVEMIEIIKKKTTKTQVMSKLLSQFEPLKLLFKKKHITKIFKNYYTKVLASEEIYYYKIIEEYFKIQTSMFKHFFERFHGGQNKTGNIESISDVLETVMYFRENNGPFEDMFTANSSLMSIIWDEINLKIKDMACDLLANEYTPFSLYKGFMDKNYSELRYNYLINTIDPFKNRKREEEEL